MEKRRERSIEEGDPWLMMPLHVVDPSFAFQFSKASVSLLPLPLLINKLLLISFLVLGFVFSSM